MYENRGEAAAEPATKEQVRTLQTTADSVADDVRVHLSGAFEVESQVVTTPAGPTAAVSIYPPESRPVAAGIPLDEAEELTPDRRQELTVELVAAAVGRARDTVGDRFMQAAQ